MNIFLTFDYELFLGNTTGTIQNCLIYPMNQIAHVLNKYGVKMVVFVDATYLLRMKELKGIHNQLELDYLTVTNHIKQLSDDGHDIQFHFHPQWFSSDYDEKDCRWRMNPTYYKISDLPRDLVYDYFSSAKLLLEKIINKKCIAFRAGGLSLTSFVGYAELLRNNGIRIDSSVGSRSKVTSRFQEYDYRNVPKKSSFKFDNDINIENPEGNFLEMQISHSNQYNALHYYLKKRVLLRKFGLSTKFGDGESLHLPKFDTYKMSISKILHGLSFQASIDGFMSINLYNIYSYLKSEKQSEMVILSHPKLVSIKSIKNLELFIQNVLKESSFMTFDQL